MATPKHTFENICIDWKSVLEQPPIANMLKVIFAQSKSVKAKKAVDLPNYKDYGIDEDAPMYLGLFVEWYAQMFLNHFGSIFNVGDVVMGNVEGSADVDNGTDGEGKSLQKRKGSVSAIIPSAGTPVFIQVKGTRNPTKEYKANDGSRLPNFMMNAATTAIARGAAYQARYVLFTTGKGLHCRLDTMSNKMMEVIGIKQIKQLGDNVNFLNVLRREVGLKPTARPEFKKDAEAEYNLTHPVD